MKLCLLEIKANIKGGAQNYLFKSEIIKREKLAEIFLDEIAGEGWVQDYLLGLYNQHHQSRVDFMNEDVALWFLQLFSDESLINVLLQLLNHLKEIFADFAGFGIYFITLIHNISL